MDKIKKYIENKNKEITKILDTKKNYNIKFIDSNKNKDKMIGIFDENKLVIAGEYHFFGIFQPSTNIWLWASSIPGINKKHIRLINKLKQFNYLFESSNDIKNEFYYQLLTQDMIYITDNKYLMWINELLIYLANDMYFFNPTNSNGNIQFITLVNNKENY